MSCRAKRRWSRVALLSGIFLIAFVMTIGGMDMWNNVEKNEHVGGFEVFDQARELRGHYALSTLRFESEFVIEWVNYHLWIGFSHMIIYDEDNAATSELAKLLAHYISEGVVTLIEWPAGEQSQAYRHGLRTFGQHATSLTRRDGPSHAGSRCQKLNRTPKRRHALDTSSADARAPANPQRARRVHATSRRRKRSYPRRSPRPLCPRISILVLAKRTTGTIILV